MNTREARKLQVDESVFHSNYKLFGKVSVVTADSVIVQWENGIKLKYNVDEAESLKKANVLQLAASDACGFIAVVLCWILHNSI